MKAIFTSVLLLTAAAGAAQAADPIVSEPFVPVVESFAYDWNGFYAGIHGGFASGTTDVVWGVIGGPFPNNDGPIDISSAFGGVHAGGNWQSDAFVFGVEGLVDYIPIFGTDGGTGGDENTITGGVMGTLVGRVGFAADSVLFYLTGGGAVLTATGDVVDPGEEESAAYTFFGGTVGAGVEVGLTDTITARLDYKYYAFGTQTAAYPANGYELGFNPTFHAVSAGVSVGF